MRSAGMISIGESTQRVFQRCQAIRTIAADASIREMASPRGDGMLSLAGLRYIESQLGMELPDDVLSVLACRIPAVTRASGIELDFILDHAENARARARIPEDLVAIGLLSPEPFVRHDPGHGPDPEYVCIQATSPALGRTSVRLDGAETSVPLDELISEHLNRWCRDHDIAWPEVLRAAHAPLASGFSLRIQDDLPPPAPGARAALRVHHATFGVGTVVGELESDKLEIEFEGAGRRILHHRFVTFDGPA